MVYLFVGQDSLSKDIQLKKLRQQFLQKNLKQFNLDILYAAELTLKGLQEHLLYLPLNNPQRIIVIKDADKLPEEAEEFILRYVRKPFAHLVLVLDIIRHDKRDKFLSQIYRYAKTFYFKEVISPDTFTLTRQIELKRTAYALQILNQLLKKGERAERILGGLRYAWERQALYPLERKRRLRLLLDCDIDIKTGRLKSSFALEKLVVSLCGFHKSFH